MRMAEWSLAPCCACLPPKVCSVVLQVVTHLDGKVERHFLDGRRTVTFSNGTCKEQLPDGRSAVHFTNGDMKKFYPSGGCPRRTVHCSDVHLWSLAEIGGTLGHGRLLP